MDTEYEPIINNWYRHPDSQLHFCIIDIDETAEVLDIQLADGDLDTLDIDIWNESNMELAVEPENWAITQGNLSEDPDDNTAETKDPFSWQYALHNNAIQSSPLRDQDREQVPDAIDEQVYLHEWQEEEDKVAESG